MKSVFGWKIIFIFWKYQHKEAAVFDQKPESHLPSI